MYLIVYLLVHLTFLNLSHARSTVFISHNGEKSYLRDSSDAEVCMTPTCVVAAANVLTSLDETADPCEDFYSFACGGWMKKQEVSDDQPERSALTRMRKDLVRKLRDLLERPYESSDPPFVQMIKYFYNSCIDSDSRENNGTELMQNILRRLGGWPVAEGNQWDESSFDWVDTLISFRKLGYDYRILLGLFVHFSDENATELMFYLQGPHLRRLARANLTLGLDDPDIAAYYRMMVNAAKLLGVEESAAEKEMLDVLNFEMTLIKLTDDDDDNNQRRNSTVYTVSQLQKELPQVPWLKIINGLSLTVELHENDSFMNENPDFLVKFVDLIGSTEKRVVANYILWKAVQQSKDYLSEEWKDIEEKKDERGSENTPLWKTCLSMTLEKLKIGLSSYYVKNYFSDESKDEAMILVKYILKEFIKILDNNDWMDEKTKALAEAKALAIKQYIGYPKDLLNDTFIMKNYENLTITTDSYLENILKIRKWSFDKLLSKVNRPATELYDKRMMYEFSNILEVNAFYNFRDNSIVIPAGILHDAFYDKGRPNYMNFAEIGYIMGHEITHGFDNQGRNYDKDGDYVNWWDEESDKHFTKKVKCIIDQYDNFTTDIGIKLNGEKTQNENIADNGGLKEAYLAYNEWTKGHGTEPLLPGVNYTQNQVFWLSAAHVWCTKYQPERLKELLVIDVHSPGKFRIIGPMSNLAEFSKDFNCSPDASMNRKYKCEVW